MNKRNFMLLAQLGAMVLNEHGEVRAQDASRWHNVDVNQQNRAPRRAAFFAFENQDKAQAFEKKNSAGLGGGSSDAAFMIRVLDERFRLNIGNPEMERYAARLGADCAFFIEAEPAYAEGIGDVLMPADGPDGNLHGYYLCVVKPDVAVSTKEAYSAITPKKPAKSCRDIVRQPIETWKEELVNDFEEPIFKMHPELAAIKQKLYDQGAVYASMSGSGSALYGIFKKEPKGIKEQFDGMFCEVMKL